eukprot:m.308579 g.308579  ORF g.308579 m.308579 type:complete len:278 (+) comp23029_c0_seq2:495-1328(+)
MEAVQQLLNKSNIVKSVRTYYRRAVDLRSDAEQSNLGLLDSLLDGLQSDGAHTDISWSALGNDHFELSQLRVVFPSPESGIDALLPLIFLDATHLSTSTLKLLIAVGSDALHNLHVLGFSFARQETIAAYTYLLQGLVLASPQLAVQPVTVMSDHGAAVTACIAQRYTLPNAKHHLCSWHMANSANEYIRKKGGAALTHDERALLFSCCRAQTARRLQAAKAIEKCSRKPRWFMNISNGLARASGLLLVFPSRCASSFPTAQKASTVSPNQCARRAT